MTEGEAFEDWFFGQAVEPTTKELSAAWHSWQSACKWQREVSDKLLEALKRAANDLWANEATSCGRAADRVIAEVEAMRKEQE